MTGARAGGRGGALAGTLAGAAIPRVVVLWCPDWPITAAAKDAALPPGTPLALVSKGLVFAASVAARDEGVRRGIRVREAQARCPELAVLEYDPATDNRVFEPIIAGLEDLSPGVQLLRPGVCALRVRGAAQYYGGEKAAAFALAGRADELGAGATRAGIADGIFTAEHAARSALANGQRVTIVPPEGSATFLAPLDVALVDDAALVTLLRRLGIRTLGDFAALDSADVRSRFGDAGARVQALAGGRDSWPLTPRTPPADFDVSIDFEPALDRVDQVAFGVRGLSDEFVEALTRARLVCTAIRVELASDSGEESARVWLHPRSFTAADVVDRVRWQVQGSGVIDEGLSSGIVRVRISPEAVDPIAHHESGLWGTGPDERIHHGLSRVQSMLGHGAVLMPSVGGGRSLAERQQLVAWGDRPVGARSTNPPWPGQLPAPLPATVFSQRHAVNVFAAGGQPVAVDARGTVSAPPLELAAGRSVVRLTAWAGPWPLDERWWSPESARRAWRFQAVDSAGCAWLLALDGGGNWWAEARYD